MPDARLHEEVEPPSSSPSRPDGRTSLSLPRSNACQPFRGRESTSRRILLFLILVILRAGIALSPEVTHKISHLPDPSTNNPPIRLLENDSGRDLLPSGRVGRLFLVDDRPQSGEFRL
jgi:hypothetical protein